MNKRLELLTGNEPMNEYWEVINGFMVNFNGRYAGV